VFLFAASNRLFTLVPNGVMNMFVSIVGAILFIFSFFFFDWTWTIIFGSLFFSNFFQYMVGYHSVIVVKENALHSPILFCFLVKHNLLRVIDNKTKTVFKFT
jgi:hypothetical protein